MGDWVSHVLGGGVSIGLTSGWAKEPHVLDYFAWVLHTYTSGDIPIFQ